MTNQPRAPKRWWSAPTPAQPTAGYRITCACGRVSTGARGKDFQAVRCAGCQAELFILPQSPSPTVSPPPEAPAPAPPLAAPHQRRVLWPWVLAAASLLAVTIAGLVLASNPPAEPFGSQDPTSIPARPSSPPDPTAQLKLHRATADQHLAQGNFRLAVTELDDALDVLKTHPKLCSAEERLSLLQLQKQTDLLGALCAESLEEILRHAAGRQEKEWEADFQRRYQGQAFLFDCELTQSSRGDYRQSYLLALPEEKARLYLDDIPAFRPLPADSLERVIFGGRLASVRRERPGFWAVRFEPESVVLFTEPAGLALCCPALGDESGRDILKRQRRWLAAAPPVPEPRSHK